MAAPAESRTPNLHRAHVAQGECGWKGGDSIITRPRKQLQPKGASSLVSPRCIFDNADSSAVKAQDELAALGLEVLLAGERLPPSGRNKTKKNTVDTDRPSHGRTMRSLTAKRTCCRQYGTFTRFHETSVLPVLLQFKRDCPRVEVHGEREHCARAMSEGATLCNSRWDPSAL